MMPRDNISSLIARFAIVLPIVLFVISCGLFETSYPPVTELFEREYCEYIRWSPDGSKIAFWGAYYDDEYFYSYLCINVWDEETGDICCLAQLSEDNLTDIITDVEFQYGLCWTNDGNYILCSFERYANYDKEFWQVSLAHSAYVEIDLPHNHQPMYPDISPDGRWLTYTCEIDNACNIWKIEIQPGMPIEIIGEPIQLTFTGGAWGSCWSPDGSKLAYCAGPNEDDQIFTIPAVGGEPTQITPDDDNDHEYVCWSSDGAWLIYSGDPWPYCLWRIPSMGGTPERITYVEKPDPPDNSISPT